MKKNDTVVTGKLEYKKIKFIFVFDGEKLRLIPLEKEDEIYYEWFQTQVREGVYIDATPKADVPFLKGIAYENGYQYIFMTRKSDSIGCTINFENFRIILFINVSGYIELTSHENEICEMSFTSPEINYIYPLRNAIKCIKHSRKTGEFSLKTLNYDSTTTDKQCFKVDGKEITVFFAIARVYKLNKNEPPLTFESSMNFSFEPTLDYEFVMRLYWIAIKFIRFLCYRKNVALPKVRLSIRLKDEKTSTNKGELHIVGNQKENELNTLKEGRYIKHKYIKGYERFILSGLSENSLYTKHIPDSYSSGRKIDAARFIMIVSAFEWEFSRLYQEGVPKDDDRKEAEVKATKAIKKLIDKSSGKLKDIYKFLEKLIGSDSLQKKVIKMGDDYDYIIGKFGNNLYNSKGEELNYKEMGRRIAEQRNCFAHGDLDKDFIDNSLLDLIYMQYVIYALQLKRYNVPDDNIRKAINELFNINPCL